MFKFRIKEGEAGEPRTTKITFDNVALETPVNIHTHSEVRKHAKGLNAIREPKLNFEMQECILDLGSQDQVNTEFGSSHCYQLKERINSIPKHWKRNMLQVRFNPKKVTLSPKQLLDLVKCQKANSDLSIFTIPDPMREFSESWRKALTKTITCAQEGIESKHKSAFMPMVNLEQPRKMIQAKTDWLLKQDIHALGFRATGSDITKKIELVKNAITENEKTVWLHVFDVNKKIFEASHAHLMPLLGVDTISVRKSFSFSTETKIKETTDGEFATPEGVKLKPDKRPFIPVNQRSIRDIFEGQALGFMDINEKSHTYGNVLDCTCPLCRRIGSLDRLENILSSPNRNALVQVHETHGFLAEFRNIQQSIKDNIISEYYKGKSMIMSKLPILMMSFPSLEEE